MFPKTAFQSPSIDAMEIVNVSDQKDVTSIPKVGTVIAAGVTQVTVV